MRYQTAVDTWMSKCFTDPVKRSKKERAMRFFEEATELAQAAGLSPGDALSVIKYVFDRPVGDLRQEVGGISVTLAALCNAFDVDMGMEAMNELERINQPEVIERIRAKQADKPHAEDGK